MRELNRGDQQWKHHGEVKELKLKSAHWIYSQRMLMI